MLMVGCVCELGMTCSHVQGEREWVRDGAMRPGELLGFRVRSGEAWLDLVHQVEAVWALICALHTRCLLIWPQEKYFQNLSNQKLGEAPKIYDTHQCHLFAKRNCFAEIH